MRRATGFWFGRWALPLAVGFSIVAKSGHAEADVVPAADPQAACIEHHRQAQRLRKADDLKSARAELLECSNPSCHSVIRSECSEWYQEVDKSIPTIVLDVRSERGDETDVTVTIDGTEIATKLTGKPVELNPGEHEIVVVLPNKVTATRRVLMHEGEKMRSVVIDSKPAPPMIVGIEPPPVAKAPGISPLAYVFTGTAAVGLGVAVYAGATGLSQNSTLKSSCSPNCPSDRIDKLKTTLLIADIGGGVAIASAAAALYFYLHHPSSSVITATLPVRVDVMPLEGGAYVGIGGRL